MIKNFHPVFLIFQLKYKELCGAVMYLKFFFMT